MLVRIDLRLNGVHKNMNILPPVQDTVIGKIYFLLVRIKLKHMEIEIRRRETIGSGSNARNESETLAKYEIMDGAPVRGENIPIRWAWMSVLRTEPCGPHYFAYLKTWRTNARGGHGIPCCGLAFVHHARLQQERRRHGQARQTELYTAHECKRNPVHCLQAVPVTL